MFDNSQNWHANRQISARLRAQLNFSPGIASHYPTTWERVQCSAVQCSAVQCSAVQCSTVQYSAVQCSSLQCIAVCCVQCQIQDIKSAPSYPHTSLQIVHSSASPTKWNQSRLEQITIPSFLPPNPRFAPLSACGSCEGPCVTGPLQDYIHLSLYTLLYTTPYTPLFSTLLSTDR